MSFCKTVLPMRLRMLLGLVIAAGAGILLTYFAAKRVIEPLTLDETGELLYASVNVAAAEINAGISYAQGKARALASREDLKALLADPEAPGKERALREVLGGAAKNIPELTAVLLRHRSGRTVYAAVIGGGQFSPEIEKALPAGGEVYTAPPLIESDRLVYEVAIPLAAGGRAAEWTLCCRFLGAHVPHIPSPPSCTSVSLQLAKRKGEKLLIAGPDGKRAETSLRSEAAAPFLPALQGKEGHSSPGDDKETLVYSYTRLQSSDWLLAATAVMPAHTMSLARAALEKIRLQAWILFALLSAAAFAVVRIMPCPASENAGAAAALLEEIGLAPPEDADPCSESETVNKALTEAFALFRKREESGLELKSETEKLREEDEELKNQNVELEKLNKYLLEREGKISELKAELRELQGKVERVKGE